MAVSESAASFGPFRLLPAQQLLLENERPVRLGSRALEILIALVERAGELVSKNELMARVWPHTVVEESNLKTHIANLRRILGDGQPGRRYLATVPGRGYCFVAPVEFLELEPPPQLSDTTERAHNLPALQTRAVGRDDTINVLLNQLPQHRFITVAGAGGIGKTTVALAVAEALIASYEHGVRFVDLGPLRDPHLVPGALASALGLAIHSDDAVPGLISHLEDKRMLLVLDSCEHVIEAAATLAEQILRGASAIHVLATSREPMRAKGERVHRLLPLEFPLDSAGLTASQALSFASVRLFVERASANIEGFELKDTDAPAVAGICRKLEGIPLAIELAATRVDAFGIRQLSILLDDRIRLLKYDRRTALPRHQTLAAALDWSYEFLPEHERALLRRLSVFSSFLTLDSASAVAANANSDVVEDLASLVAKSLVSADVSGGVVQYRLLDTTRAYAMQKLTESGEFQQYVRRHAEHHRDLFERTQADWEEQPSGEWVEEYGRRIDDVRSALNWAFSPSGDASIGVALTVASIPLWMRLSFMDECREWVERALASHLAEPNRNERDEMKLLVALGTALPNAGGPLPATEVTWTKALWLAKKLDEDKYQLRAMWGLFVYRMYVGDHREALLLAEEFCALSDKKGDAGARLIGDRLTGIALHYLGDHANARRHLDRVLTQYVVPSHWSHIVRFLVDHRVAARTTLSRILWIQGFPDQAVRSVQSTLDEARATDHALSLCNVLAHAACPIALYVGDLTAAETLVTTLLDQSAKHALTAWNALGGCLKGGLLLARGDAAGSALLRNGVQRLREVRFGFYDTTFLDLLAQGLAAAGQTAEARVAIDAAIERCDSNEGRWCLPELLRIKGEILRRDGSIAAVTAAEEHFMQALEWARRQQALSWELRAATNLAELWHGGGKTAEAEQLLSSVYDRFSEGFETVDLEAARALIAEFRKALADH
ncbi:MULTISPECIES: ATP-binding protein [Bradyrhizobium]|uniref:ATP-binding protein n=1 Tax=Bradyrhizobium elkanii TaxID=29448 RepID=UPI00040F92A0|nr:winged helix-turn-helix domain-containing protein [Bradyrhizobium elkanii]